MVALLDANVCVWLSIAVTPAQDATSRPRCLLPSGVLLLKRRYQQGVSWSPTMTFGFIMGTAKLVRCAPADVDGRTGVLSLRLGRSAGATANVSHARTGGVCVWMCAWTRTGSVGAEAWART